MNDLAYLLAGVHPAGLAICLAAAMAFGLRVILAFQKTPGTSLPHPSKVPGLPMAGPASTTAAHVALNRRAAVPRPTFRT